MVQTWNVMSLEGQLFNNAEQSKRPGNTLSPSRLGSGPGILSLWR